MVYLVLYLLIVFTAFPSFLGAQTQTIKPLRTIVELNVGDSAEVGLHNGQKVTVALLSSEVTRDEFRNAVHVQHSLVIAYFEEGHSSLRMVQNHLVLSVRNRLS